MIKNLKHNEKTKTCKVCENHDCKNCYVRRRCKRRTLFLTIIWVLVALMACFQVVEAKSFPEDIQMEPAEVSAVAPSEAEETGSASDAESVSAVALVELVDAIYGSEAPAH